ncbi:hypothetical protein N7456_012193 [Penicillium angulare]|uniref:Uncharacterized protein n=1 Tax=Penicillium angulare TaxID=116970 RepID=A0A9W9K1F8_9EURO|nr:hypothetical protein N7456_012193 [Penicillium angulare]
MEEVYDLDSKADEAEAVQSIVDHYTLLALKELDEIDLPVTPKGQRMRANLSDEQIRLLDDLGKCLWTDLEEASLTDDFASLNIPCQNTEAKHAQEALKTAISSGQLPPEWLKNHMLSVWNRMKGEQNRKEKRKVQRKTRR